MTPRRPTPAGPAGQPAPRIITPELVRAALAAIPADVDRDTWVRLGMAIKAELGDAGFEWWDTWSQGSQAYSATDARDVWRSIKAGGRVKGGTLFGLAKDHGFRFPEVEAPASPQALAKAQAEAQRLAAERSARDEAEAQRYRERADQAAKNAREVWAAASEQGQSPYLARKGVGAHGVRFAANGDLLVPLVDAAGELVNVQRIASQPPTDEQARAGLTEKRFLPGGRKKGMCHLLDDANGANSILLAEGYATAASLYEATGLPVAVAFDAGNLVHVARELRAAHPLALLLVCADDDRATEARSGKNPGRDGAATAARAVAKDGAPAGMVWPEGLPDGASDFNDLHQHAGLDAVRHQVMAAVDHPQMPGNRKPAKAGKPRQAGQQPAGAASAGGAGGSAPPPGAGAPAADAEPRPRHDPFRLDDDGVWHVARDADGNEKPPRWLCAPLRITARTRADDANGWGCLLEFADLDANAKSWAMPSAMLSGEGAEWAARLRDMGLQMAPGVQARNLVAQYIDTRNPAARVTCTDRVGWHAGGVYVLPTSSIAPAPAAEADDEADDAASPRRYVFQSEAGLENTFRQHGTLADWRRHVAQLCEGNSRLAFTVCCALAGPLLRPAGLESGGFHLRGHSSMGKTTALKVAASVWGRPSYMQRWRTTDNALEATAVQHCDGTLILDEIGQVDGKVVGDCAYLLANEQEKGRNTRSGMNRKRRTWKLLFLSSGEKSMAAHMAEAGKKAMAGQEVRMVDIPLDAGMGLGGLECLHGMETGAMLADAVTAAAGRHYGTAGRAWLEWLVAHHHGLAGRVQDQMADCRLALVPHGAGEQVGRVAMRFALVAAAGELAIEAGILPWAEGDAREAATVMLRAWLDARGHDGNAEEVAMLRQVRAWLEKNGDALLTWTHRAMDDHRPNTAMRAGFKRLTDDDGNPVKFDAAQDYMDKRSVPDDGRQVEYLLLPEAFARDVCAGFDAAAVAKVLRARGHLKCDDGRLNHKQRLPGMGANPVRVYHVLSSIFADEV